MFYSAYLVIEVNKFEQRFEGTIAKAIKQVVQKEKNIFFQKQLYDIFVKFNMVVNTIDNLFAEDVDVFAAYKESFHELYLNLFLQKLNIIYTLYCKGSFNKKYSKFYWQETQKLILELWKESPDKTSVAVKETSFMKIFEDLFTHNLKKMPELCVKELQDFKNLYRASTYEVFDNYKYIMPDPIYCKDNRWNDDGIAYLYLSNDNDDEDFGTIKLGQKTCFEELRLTDNRAVAVCQFTTCRANAKILDLSYQDMDYDNLLQELSATVDDIEEQVLDKVKKTPKIMNKLQQYKKSGREDLFKKQLSKIQKLLGLDDALQKNIQMQLTYMMLGNICDAIFYAVDKVDDPSLEAYIPFRKFSKYLKSIGIDGVAYRSTRMKLKELSGTCLTLFEKDDASFIPGSMEVYVQENNTYRLIKKY